MADVVWRGVSPQVFVGSCQLMSNKFLDPRSCSIRKVCYREKCGGRKEWGKEQFTYIVASGLPEWGMNKTPMLVPIVATNVGIS